MNTLDAIGADGPARSQERDGGAKGRFGKCRGGPGRPAVPPVPSRRLYAPPGPDPMPTPSRQRSPRKSHGTASAGHPARSTWASQPPTPPPPTAPIRSATPILNKPPLGSLYAHRLPLSLAVYGDGGWLRRCGWVCLLWGRALCDTDSLPPRWLAGCRALLALSGSLLGGVWYAVGEGASLQPCDWVWVVRQGECVQSQWLALCPSLGLWPRSARDGVWLV